MKTLPTKTPRARWTWRKAPRNRGWMTNPEMHYLRFNGEDIAVVQRHSKKDGYFWYGCGQNTSGRVVDLQTAKKEARAHAVSIVTPKI